MSSPRLSATSRNEPPSDDRALFAARTDCIELSTEDEDAVTSTIEALQHLLKRIAETRDEASVADSQAEDPAPASSATKYLSHFSYGLTPGESRYIIYRFLKSNNFNIPKALEDLTRTAEFRKKQNLDKMALFPCLISMSGFDQPTMCEELGIPFIHNLTSGKRYVDAEGRLRLEQDQLDYYNVQYDDIYANLAANAEHANGTPLSTPRGQHNTDRGFSGRDGSRNKSGLADSSFDSFNSIPSNDGDTRRRNASGGEGNSSSNNNNSGGGNGSATTGGWRSLIPFHVFGHSKEKSSSPPGPHSRTNSFNTNNRSGEGRRLGRFRSNMSVSGGSHNGSLSGNDEVADDQSAASQEAVLLNPAATGEALTGNPYTLFADSLNFHGILQPIIAVITKHVPFAFHYWDREGHPIMYCRLGGLNSKRLMRDLFALTPIDAEPRALAVLFNTYALAVLWQLIRYCNRKNQKSNEIHDALLTEVQRKDRRGSTPGLSTQTTGLFRKKAPVGSCVVVVDCAGLYLHRYLYKPLLVMVKSIVSMNLRHYPELLHHAYIINCRTAMSVSYLMIRSMLSEETRGKVTFCSRHNSTATLLEHISSELLPQEMGGKCQCPGGCIPSVAATMPDADVNSASRRRNETRSSSLSMHSESDATDQIGEHLDESQFAMQRLNRTVERLNLRPHGSKTLTFAMDAHTEVIWEFVVKNKQKVTFSALFVSGADDGTMLSLVPRRRVTNDAGHYICPTIGTVIFRWSNKRSFFRRCRVNLKVYREEQTAGSP